MNFKGRFFYQLTRFCALFVVGSFLSNCSLIEKPRVASGRSGITAMPHTGNMLQTCIACHTPRRPLGLVHEFDHTFGTGSGDCVLCHSSSPGITWSGGTYNHQDSNGAALTNNCSVCHGAQRPVGYIGNPAYDHANGGQGDCSSCHNNLGVTWAGGQFNHSPTPTSCSNCHSGELPAASIWLPSGAVRGTNTAPYSHSSLYGGTTDCINCHMATPANLGIKWAGAKYNHKDGLGLSVQTCIGCHVQPTGLVGSPAYDHSVSGMGDCVSCHRNPGVSWSGAWVSHTPQPTTCSTCHQGGVPAASTLLPVGATIDLYQHSSTFNGTSDCVNCHVAVPANVGVKWAGGNYDHKTSTGAMISSTCLPCHANQKPVGSVGPLPGFDHANGGSGDCAICHKNPGVSWTGGVFSHTPTPTNCKTCHSAETPAPTTLLPAGATIDLYQHSLLFNGTSDCVSCHTQVTANIGVKWAGGYFDHKTSTGAVFTTTCIPCHTNQRPVGSVGPFPGYDHVNGGTGDCASCHKNSGVSWAGALISHSPVPTSCSSCHLSERPAATSLVPTGATIDLYQHSATFNGTIDCVNCHTKVTANVGVNWTAGYYDHKTSTGALITSTCIPCHAGQRPIGSVGPAPGYDHANGGTGDCASCHTNAGTSWAGGLVSHTPTPATCSNCHGASLPGPTVTLPVGTTIDLYQHSSNFNGTADCVSCHTQVTGNIGVSWAGGYYNHKTSTGAVYTATCIPCHTGQRPVGSVGPAPGFDHANGGTGDCASCHTNSGVSWAGGQFSHSPTPATCSSCHSPTLPAPTVTLPAGATIDLYQHSSTFNGTSDCVSCHTQVAGNIGVRWAGGYYDHKTSTGALMTSTCIPCHTNQRPVGSVGPAPGFDHANGGTGDCAACHINAGVSWSGGQMSHTPIPVSCNTCHISQLPAPTTLLPAGATVDLYQHNTLFNGTSDCVNCHTKVTANVGTTWAGGYYNHKTSQGTTFTSTCLPCHTGQLPAGTVPNRSDGFTHTSIIGTVNVGTECSSCHAVVVTNIGITWQKGYFDHNGNNPIALGQTCSPCHDQKKHHSGEYCYSCHDSNYVRWPSRNSSGNYGGEWGGPPH